MKFYFSGVKSQRELDMLEAAKVDHILFDPESYKKLDVPWGPDDYWEPSYAMDSGAYRIWKNGGANYDRAVLDYSSFLYKAIRCKDFDFVVSFDVIGDAVRSLDYYDWLTTKGYRVMPVWHWGTPKEMLELYLRESDIVGIGALVEWMRGKNESVLRDLRDLCFQYPQRFHLFGLAWPKAIDALAPYAYSADSSVWLRGAKYRLAVFKHKQHGHLTQCPAQFLTDYKDLGREELCIQNAKNIEEFCNEQHSNC